MKNSEITNTGGNRMKTRTKIAAGVVALGLLAAGCGIEEDHKSKRGRGDTGIATCGPLGNPCIDGSKVTRVYEFADGFPNVASKCADHELRVYVSSNGDHLALAFDADCELPEFSGQSR